jgi:hypothetical protein
MSWKIRITRANVVQNITGFPTRAAAQAWVDEHVIPEDGHTEILQEAAKEKRHGAQPFVLKGCACRHCVEWRSTGVQSEPSPCQADLLLHQLRPLTKHSTHRLVATIQGGRVLSTRIEPIDRGGK